MPMARFEQMVANMDESFLVTASWGHVRERIQLAERARAAAAAPRGGP